MSWLFGGSSPVSPALFVSKEDLFREHPDMLRLQEIHNQAGPKRPLLITPGVSAFLPQTKPTPLSSVPVPIPNLAAYPRMTMTTEEMGHLFHHEPLRPPPQPSWWADLQASMRSNPVHALQSVGELAIQAMKYVGWNYVDFVDQFRSWDGTWLGLVRHSSLLWRSVVTVLLTAGLLQAGPLFLAVTEWTRMLGTLLTESFGLVGRAAELLWWALEDLVSFLTQFIERLIGR